MMSSVVPVSSAASAPGHSAGSHSFVNGWDEKLLTATDIWHKPEFLFDKYMYHVAFLFFVRLSLQSLTPIKKSSILLCLTAIKTNSTNPQYQMPTDKLPLSARPRYPFPAPSDEDLKAVIARGIERFGQVHPTEAVRIGGTKPIGSCHEETSVGSLRNWQEHSPMNDGHPAPALNAKVMDHAIRAALSIISNPASGQTVHRDDSCFEGTTPASSLPPSSAQ
jgi:hypothetical protein